VANFANERVERHIHQFVHVERGVRGFALGADVALVVELLRADFI
jgi:hypothetical protein